MHVKRYRAEGKNFLRQVLLAVRVHTTPEEFAKRRVSLETHQMFSVHTTSEKSNSTTIGHFGVVFKENSVREIV